MRTRTLTLLAVAALALPAAACGSAVPSTDGVASLGSTTTAPDAAAGDGNGDDDAGEGDRQLAMLDFAACMREHGIDMPDPQFDGRGGGFVQVGGPDDVGDMEAAQKACEPLMEDAIADIQNRLTPEEQARMQQQALDFAKCMREHGIDIPDPQFGDGGRVTIGLGGGPGGDDGPSSDGPVIDPDDPEFQEAQEACGGPGGGFAVSGGSEVAP
jgi:hypothetical protein